MGLLFEYAQSAGQDIELVFLRENLLLLQIGIEENKESFIQLLKKEHNCFDKIFPSAMLGNVLDSVFDYCLVDFGITGDTETFEVSDELFKLISSGQYENSKQHHKIDLFFESFGELVCSDLHFCIEDYDIEFEFEEQDYSLILKKMFDGDTFSFSLYNTVDLYCLADCLVNLRKNLLLVKEELNVSKNNKRVAA